MTLAVFSSILVQGFRALYVCVCVCVCVRVMWLCVPEMRLYVCVHVCVM